MKYYTTATTKAEYKWDIEFIEDLPSRVRWRFIANGLPNHYLPQRYWQSNCLLDSWEQTAANLVVSRKYISKCRLQNGSHSVPANMRVFVSTRVCGLFWVMKWAHARDVGECLRNIIDLIHKPHKAPITYPTMHHSEEKYAHFCSDWCIVVYGTGASWDLWDLSLG